MSEAQKAKSPGGAGQIAKQNHRSSAIFTQPSYARNGIEWDSLHPGSHRLKCPACGKDRRSDKTLGVTVDHTGKGVAHCFRCEYVETHTPGNHRKAPHTRREPLARVTVQMPAQFEVLNEYGKAIWKASEAITEGTVAASYLLARRCVLPPSYGDLRWHPSHKHGPSGYTGAALVALLTDVQTNEPRSLHFTWIQADGSKADVQPPRLLLGGHRKAGTVCRLWPDDEVTVGLGVAEGIETALSLAHAYKPVWSCIDAGNLSAFPVLNGIQTLVIATDRDPAGERAATECAARWVTAGQTAVLTQQAVNDLNDCAQEAA